MADYKKMDEIAEGIEDTVNVMGTDPHDNMEYLANKMLNLHRTLNQSFTSKFILKFIKKMAENYKQGFYDARNEWACRLCNEMWDVVSEHYGNEINLPLI